VNNSYITFDGLVADAINCTDNGAFYITDNIYGGLTTDIVIKNGTARNASRAPNVLSWAGNGILTNPGRTNHQFINNDIYNNGYQGHGHGIYNTGGGNLIDSNRIYNNAAYGIHLYNGWGYGVDDNVVRNNVIYGHPYRAVIIESGWNNLFSGNLVHENGRGLDIYGSGQRILSNTIYDNSGFCIWLEGSGHQVKSNACYRNEYDTIGGNLAQSDVSNNSFGVSTTPPTSSENSSSAPSNPTVPDVLSSPTGLTAECTTDGRNFTVRWNPVPGADRYYLRVDYAANNVQGAWYIEQGPDYNIDQYNGTSFSAPVIPGHVYWWWVHGANPSAGLGPASWGEFTCR